MILSRYTIHNIQCEAVQVPDKALFELPEKVLQFGAGAVLRSGPDYWMDQANRLGIFNGRVVVVEENVAQAALFEKQDCLYTVQHESEYSIVSSISRVLPIKEQWQQVLECAHNAEIKLILSHTAPKLIRLVNDNVRLHPPRTFPGQLLAFLYERFKAFGGSVQSGLLIVPAEEVPENGKKLEAVVFELAHLNGLDDGFIEWLESCNQFCNSAFANVAPSGKETKTHVLLNDWLGYTDSLLVTADKSGGWNIEGDDAVKKFVSFAPAGDRVAFLSVAAPESALKLPEP